MAALQITEEQFEAEVLKSDKPVLVDFWAISGILNWARSSL